MTADPATATDLRVQLEQGDSTASEILDGYLARIRRLDPRLGSFLHVAEESARRQAEELDRRRRRGERLGPLAGIPVAIKDNICTADQPTTCGSRMLASFRPPYDATVIARLRQADAVLIGKTNLDEFAMGSTTENSSLGVTRNPWNPECVPGGSSGGSAACVAADLAPLALGSDTGGSIRQPAAFCGVIGLKPTYGRVSRFGLVAFASSLDQIGPFARSAEDAARLLQAIAGPDPADSTAAPHPVPDYLAALGTPLAGLRIGVLPEQLDEGIDPEVGACVRQAVAAFQSQGATVESVELPHSRYAIATYYLVASCEASSNLARYDGAHYGYRTDEREMLAELEGERLQLERRGDTTALEALDSPLVRMYRRTRSEGFGDEVKRRVMLGTYALSAGYYDAYYLKALQVRRLIRQDYDRAFERVDVLIGPATPHPAYRLGEKCSDPLAMYLGDLFTVGANLAGIPAISIPCGFTAKGLPVGLQIQTSAFGEARLLQLAAAYQNATSWHQQRPQPA